VGEAWPVQAVLALFECGVPHQVQATRLENAMDYALGRPDRFPEHAVPSAPERECEGFPKKVQIATRQFGGIGVRKFHCCSGSVSPVDARVSDDVAFVVPRRPDPEVGPTLAILPDVRRDIAEDTLTPGILLAA
jgi:hypothetical protein